MEVMAILGFICALGIGLYLLVVGGVAVIGMAMFTGEFLTPVLGFPIVGAVFIWAAFHWAPFLIVFISQ